MADDIAVIGILKKVEFTGFNIKPYLYRPDSLPYISDLERITPLNIASYSYLPDGALELFTISQLLDHKTIIEKYSKINLTAKEFFSKNLKLYENIIRPYYDSNIAELIEILIKHNIPLYNYDALPHLYETDQIYIESLKATTLLKFDRTNEGTTYTLQAYFNKQKIDLQDQKNLLLTVEPCYIISNKHLLGFEKSVNGKLLTPFFTKEHIQIPKHLENHYFATFIRKIVNTSEIQASGFEIEDISRLPTAHLSLEINWQGIYCLILYFQYGTKKIFLSNPEKNFTELNSNSEGFTFYRSKRNGVLEEKKKKALTTLGLIQYDNYFRLSAEIKEDKPYGLVEWLIKNKKNLQENEFIIDQNLGKNYLIEDHEIIQKLATGNDWFDLYIDIKVGTFILPFSLFKNHLLRNNREYILPDGQIFILPEEWFERYQELLIHAETKGNYLQLQKHHFKILNTLNFEEVSQFNQTINIIEQELPPLVNISLRSYQITGFKWMLNLCNMKFGGILADDMGLGKTIQTIALLANYYKNTTVTGWDIPLKNKECPDVKGSTKDQQLDLFGPLIPVPEKRQIRHQKEIIETLPCSLLVMPSSLIHNWINELSKFAPFIKVFAYTGSGRKQSKNILKKYNLILTTYGTLRNDIGFLSDYEFVFTILDESQQIKNPESKTARAVLNLKSKYKFALSGTPVENNLIDLWSQMNFVNPGLLGDLNVFNTFYSVPLTKDPEGKQAEKLLSMISPFILRRTKESVAPELPELTETISYCTMSDGQRSLYESEKSKIRNTVFNIFEKGNIQLISSTVLKALMQLRQIANHPRMIDIESSIESGKFEEVTDKLQTIIAENHRVLIFSSFVKHLRILEEYCNSNGLDYSILTGSSINRGKIISDFKTNQAAKIFLISLKAGGLGLNLTEADYVFILDPWWNPAAEMQAVNRAHRIGQHKNVFVYRFISKDTIEEKILRLQEKKKALADAFIKPQSAILNMSKEEIIQLFE